MEILITLLIIVAVAAVMIWLINQIPLPEGLGILKTLGIALVVIVALTRIFPLL